MQINVQIVRDVNVQRDKQKRYTNGHTEIYVNRGRQILKQIDRGKYSNLYVDRESIDIDRKDRYRDRYSNIQNEV